MSESEVSRIPLRNLWTSYGYGRTKFYEILASLNITTTSEGNRAYLSLNDKKLLDQYFSLDNAGRYKFICDRSRMLPEQDSEVEREAEALIPSTDSADTFPPSLSQSQWLQLFQLFADKADKPERTYLECQRELAEYAKEGYLIPTSEARSLLGVTPRGDVFVRGSWKLYRCDKIGQEAAWKVERVTDAD